MNKHIPKGIDKGPKASGFSGSKNSEGTKGMSNPYAHVVKGNTSHKEIIEDSPSMVLDESCENQDDFSLSLLGKVKEFASLNNLKVVLGKKGFDNFALKYMGGLWVLIVFQDEDTKVKCQTNLAVGSWFSQIIQAHCDFVIDERVMWVEIVGVPCKWWSRNTFSRIASRWGTILNGQELEEGYHSNRICISTKVKKVVIESFKMVYRGKIYWVRAVEVPGWVPDFEEDNEDETIEEDGINEDEEYRNISENYNRGDDESDGEEILETIFEDVPDNHIYDVNSIRQSDVPSEDPFGIYAMLNKKRAGDKKEGTSEESLKFPPGFSPKDASSDSVVEPDILSKKNIDSDNKEEGGNVNIQVQEKMGGANAYSESSCSGHFKKSKLPNSGGSIIRLIDELVNVRQTMGYDMTGCLAQKAKKDWVRELCIYNKVNFLSLQEIKMDKMDMWCIKRCWGNYSFDFVYSESVGKSGGILSVWDPNMFRKDSATIFDYFNIVRGVWLPSGTCLLVILVYAPQELSEKKMLWDDLSDVIKNWDGEVISMGDFKEVRDTSERFGSIFNKSGAEAFNSFIVNSGLVETIGQLSCAKVIMITVQFLLNFFHFWFDIDGFHKLVGDSRNEATVSMSAQNPYSKFMLKLKYLKETIRKWNSSYKVNLKSRKNVLKMELNDIDAIIDKGEGIDDHEQRRQEVIKSFQDMEKIANLEVVQKAKIKWVIEGDENSKYYHGVLNKKRGRLAIRGVLVDGNWIEAPNLDFVNKISMEQMVDLEREVSKEEIKRAVWDCGVDKAPGPNRFTFGFYRRYWDLIENDVSNANMVKDFRPISLTGSLYKIIAKVLANRLALVIDDLVNEIQSAFVPDRQILDDPFILNEIVQWCKSRKKQSMIFKVDIEKAFDSVRWDFIDDMLRRFGFGEKWCMWIKSCLHSSRGLVLINGSPTKEFQFYKGLKQGDPLSPFLFILVMESLHMTLFSWVNGIKEISISYLGCWMFFYQASGLKINMNKSKLMGISVDRNKVDQAASQIGCLVLKLPFSYLGSKVRDSVSRIHPWNEVIHGMNARLSRWKLKTLSIGGRAESKSNKQSWVGWNKVLASKESGGLGVSSLFALNRALMFKWVWRFIPHNNSLWARVIKTLHGDDGKIGKQIHTSYPSIRLSIIKDIKALKKHGIDVINFIKPKVGNGITISFWEVAWCGEVEFKKLVPRLYALETMKSIDVATKMKIIDDTLLPSVNSKTRWINVVPIKINVLAWKVKPGYLPTRLNLSRRGLFVVLCKRSCDGGIWTIRILVRMKIGAFGFRPLILI
uniref:RNA-directed DNA polymerase, eukaryota n=1 Tax=Tanacetum cinerariifolium TaxID=118510 RepID=A0A699HZQ7_TANCI|nr:RNA-directed DNA polymerase, eukaryota [Tanacetum cinerariifolium]